MNYTLINYNLIFLMNRFSIFIICICLAITSIVKAKNYIPDKFEESLRKDVPVSGSVLTGISLSGNIPLNEGLTVFTYVPAQESWLCVVVKSIDGRYLSLGSYHVNVENPQWISLQFPSKHVSIIKEYGTQEIALLVTANQYNSDCLSQGEILLSSWHMPQSIHKQSVNVFINSGRIKSLLRHNDSKQKPYNCTDIKSTKLVTYDKVCNISFDEFKNGTWNIIRRRMGKSLPTTNFELFSSSVEPD